MKKYTYLSHIEAKQALKDGKKVEWYCSWPGEFGWRTKTNKNIYGGIRHRLAEEVEEEWAGASQKSTCGEIKKREA